MNKIIILLILFFASSLAFTNIVKAQKNDIWEKIEKIKIEKLVKKLDLDDNTAATFTEKYKSFSEAIRGLNQKRVEYYKLMAENLESGNGLDTLVDRLVSMENEINTLKMEFAKEMKTILTPKQIAIMIVFEKKFNAALKKLIIEYKKKKDGNN